jgi:hypothetical protein
MFVPSENGRTAASYWEESLKRAQATMKRIADSWRAIREIEVMVARTAARLSLDRSESKGTGLLPNGSVPFPAERS